MQANPTPWALRAQAELERRRRKATVPPTLAAWLPRVSPEWRWDWPHLRRIQDALEAITRGETRFLIIVAPVRHGKSEQVTVRYPVHRLVRRPAHRTIVGAYNQTLAEKMSRKARRVARLAGVALSPERTAANDWETLAGGGIRAVGVGAGVAGHGADLLVIDDPMKNRQEAESLVFRDRVWDWYTDDLYTRLEPRGAIVATMARWHDDDLVGRLMNGPDAGQWTVLHMPALCDQPETDPLGRVEGAALCPDRYDEDALAKIRLAIGEYGFASLYQGRPQPKSGNMFPRAKVEIVRAAPAVHRWCRAWDKAGSKDAGKRTAGVKLGIAVDTGKVVVADSRVGQWEAADRAREMLNTARLDGTSCLIQLEQEPGSGGKESAQASITHLQGFPVEAKPASGDKVTRAEPFASQWQAGNVILVEGAWNRDYLDEMAAAPSGKFLDQMDASAMAYNRLTTGSRTFSSSRIRTS